MESEQCGGIDLHIHSTASDGSYSPSDIIAMAANIGLQAIAITDHDTLDGACQALECDIPSGLRLVTGVEISAQPPPEFKIGGSLHILGYGVDPNHPKLTQTLRKFQKIRDSRTHRMLDQLHQLGIPLTLEQVMAEVGEGAASRPHIASAMVKAGIVTNFDDAFQKYLGIGRPAYVNKERLSCQLTFELIATAGGIPVLAHPYLIPYQSLDQLDYFIRLLSDMGLKGIEVYYSKHPAEAVRQYIILAEKYDLLATGGSDFHGRLTPEIRMGKGTGDLFVPYELFEKMIVNFGLKNVR